MNFSGSSTFFRGIGFTLALPMNLLGMPACRAEASKRRLTSRRPVGSRKPELAGETPVVAVLCPGKPALPGTAARVHGPDARPMLEVEAPHEPLGSAGFQTCRIADFQVGSTQDVAPAAGLEIRDTADLEVCATCHRWFRGSRREMFFGEFSPRLSGEGENGAVRGCARRQRG